MSTSITTSNVFYLEPAVQRVETPRARRPRLVALHHALRSAWWRLRLSAVEVYMAIRRPGTGLLDDQPVFFDDVEEPTERARPRVTQPARVIDFCAARQRLRPLA